MTNDVIAGIKTVTRKERVVITSTFAHSYSPSIIKKGMPPEKETQFRNILTSHGYMTDSRKARKYKKKKRKRTICLMIKNRSYCVSTRKLHKFATPRNSKHPHSSYLH